MGCVANRFQVNSRFGSMIGLADAGVNPLGANKQFDCSECPHVRVCVLLCVLCVRELLVFVCVFLFASTRNKRQIKTRQLVRCER